MPRNGIRNVFSLGVLVGVISAVGPAPAIAAASPAQASCTPVDLRAEFARRTGTERLRNQGPRSWCFGFMAADLLSFHAGSAEKPTQFSALDAVQIMYSWFRENAVEFSDPRLSEYRPLRITDDLPRGAYTPKVFSELKSKGLCLEKDVRSGDPDGNLHRLLGRIQGLSLELELEKNKRRKPASPPDPLLVCRSIDAVQEVFPSLLNAQVKEVLLASPPSELFGRLFELSCERNGRVRDLPAITVEPVGGRDPALTREHAHAALDRELEQGKVAGIQIFQDFILSPGCKHGRAGKHDLLVVGRRWNGDAPGGGRCEYLLRNSWGEGCESYRCGEIRCDQGNAWVPATLLSENLTEVIRAVNPSGVRSGP